ncbi:hypothetical protein GCM10010177_65970 [Actinomadura citrea]|nr:hypothetical protein GCM10010177_65970 [Actinomadura citrea]
MGTEGFDPDNPDTTENAKFTFKGVPRSASVPDAPSQGAVTR